MRLAFVHADSFAFEATRVADREAAETDLPESDGIDGGLAAFLGVERTDLADPAGVGAAAAAELRAIAEELRVEAVALYPAPGLVDDPADADGTADVLREVAAALREDCEVVRAPVGYDAAVEVAWKGHPTSEGSRRVRPPEADDGAAPEWLVALPDGRRLDPGAARSEADASLAAVPDSTPDHRRILRERGLAGDGALSPRGTFLRDALLARADAVAREVGATRVRPSPAVDRSEEGIRGALAATGADPLPLADEGATALSPGGDAAVLATLSDRRIPDPAFPVARYARNERVPRPDGETVEWVASPRITVLEADRQAARERALAFLARARTVAADLELDADPVVRVRRAFDEANPGVVEAVLDSLDGAIPVAVHDDDGPCLAVELGVCDGAEFLPGPAVVVDTRSAADLGIERADGGGEPVAVSVAPVGDAERTLAAAVSAARRRGRPRLPTWLAPTQVRLVPLADDHLSRCEGIADELEAAGVRVDVDDRGLRVGERIDRARREWVPHVAVVGDREAGADELDVTDRATGREERRSVADLAETVRSAVGGRPALRSTLPRRLDARAGADLG